MRGRWPELGRRGDPGVHGRPAGRFDPIDYRLPNRQITIPLNLRTLGATTFSTIRSSLQQKVGLFQRQQGQIMRQVGSTPLYADMQSATLHLGGAWLQAYRDVDVDAVLTLECLPDWYGDEITLTTHTETTLPHLFFTEATINGNYPGRVRIIATNGTAVDQHGLLWGLRSQYYNAGTTAALFYEAESLSALNLAAGAALAGASGGTVITQGSLPANTWVPILATSMKAGTIPLTHLGSYRVWARCYSGSATPEYQFVWGVGSLSAAITNSPVQLPSAGQFYLLDLGEIRLDPPPVGPNQWFGQIQSQVVAVGQAASIDCVYFQPLDDGAGKLAAVQTTPGAAQAQAFPSTGVDDATVGSVAWSNPGNVSAWDGRLVQASLTFAQDTHYVKATGFGFAIPSTATIAGIKVEAPVYTTPAQCVRDLSVKLVKAGTISGSDRAVISGWVPGQLRAWGGSTDLWGSSWRIATSTIQGSVPLSLLNAGWRPESPISTRYELRCITRSRRVSRRFRRRHRRLKDDRGAYRRHVPPRRRRHHLRARLPGHRRPAAHPTIRS